jgi:hypothetical protein
MQKGVTSHAFLLYRKAYATVHTGSGGAPMSTNPQDQDTRPTSPAMDDKQVLFRARSAGNGAKFRALFDDGDLAGYGGDPLKAAKALCSLLAFWTQNPEQIARLVGCSALEQAPTDETIAWVIAHTSVRYHTGGAPPAQADVRFSEMSDDEIASLSREELEERFKRRGALLDRISNLVHNTSTMKVADKHGVLKDRYILSPCDKLAGIEGYFETMATGDVPERVSRDKPGRVQVCRETMGRKIGISASAVGDALEVLSRQGYFGKRVVRRSPEDRVMYLWTDRVIPASTQLQPIVPKHRGRARAWQCACGSRELVRHTTYRCRGCGRDVPAEELQPGKGGVKG